MQIVAKDWGTKSDIGKPEFERLIKKLRLSNWSRLWEYPFAILNSNIQRGLRILDAGCGGSPLIGYFKEEGCEIHGVDIEELTIPGLHFHRADLRYLPFGANFFDRVFCISVLEHIPDDPMKCLNELIRVLKFGGLLAVTVDINRNQSSFLFRQLDFDMRIGQFLGFETGRIPEDILKSESTKAGRACGSGLSVFGFVLKK